MGHKAVEIESVDDVHKMQSGGIWLDSGSLSPLIAGVTLWNSLRVISFGQRTKSK